MAPTPTPASYRQAAGIRLRETREREVVVSGVIVVQADSLVKALAGVAHRRLYRHGAVCGVVPGVAQFAEGAIAV